MTILTDEMSPDQLAHKDTLKDETMQFKTLKGTKLKITDD